MLAPVRHIRAPSPIRHFWTPIILTQITRQEVAAARRGAPIVHAVTRSEGDAHDRSHVPRCARNVGRPGCQTGYRYERTSRPRYAQSSRSSPSRFDGIPRAPKPAPVLVLLFIYINSSTKPTASKQMVGSGFAQFKSGDVDVRWTRAWAVL